MFQSVYHGKYAFFGNYAYPDGTRPWDPLWPPEDRWKEEKPWHNLYPDQFYLELGRTVVWGVQPMVCNIKENLFTDPELAPALRFTLETARFYHANIEFLFDGQMLSPAGFTCATAPVDYLIRSIFTKEHECKPRQRCPLCCIPLGRHPMAEGTDLGELDPVGAVLDLSTIFQAAAVALVRQSASALTINSFLNADGDAPFRALGQVCDDDERRSGVTVLVPMAGTCTWTVPSGRVSNEGPAAGAFHEQRLSGTGGGAAFYDDGPGARAAVFWLAR